MSDQKVRLQLGQAQERWPDQAFMPLGGAMTHAVTSRYEQTLLCTAACGFVGFAPSVEATLSADSLVCMRCVSALARRALAGKDAA